jgi:hypothetical protein
MTTFEAWYSSLSTIAASKGLGFLVGDPESHRAAFEDGLSPEDEISEQAAAAIDAI